MAARGAVSTEARKALVTLAMAANPPQGMSDEELARALMKVFAFISTTENGEAEDLFIQKVGLPKGQSREELQKGAVALLPHLTIALLT